jgi:hypothetical protein
MTVDSVGLGEPRCPEATRHGPLSRDGRCPWCRRKVGRAWPAPTRHQQSNLSDAYRRTYDPDWGTDVRDTDPYWPNLNGEP